MALLAVAALLIALGAAAYVLTGSRKGGAASGDRTAYTPRLDYRATIPGATTLPQIVSAVMGRYGGHLIVSGQPGIPRGPKPRSGAWLHFVVVAPAQDERATRPEWEADLVEGAVADAFEASTRQPVVDSRIDLKLPDGTIVNDASGGIGEIVPGQDFSGGSDADIKASLSAELAQQHLTPVSIDVLRAAQPAPVVVATTSDPRGAAKDANKIIGALFGINPPKYEGYYLEIRDTSSKTVIIESAAFRAGSGRVWVRPGLEAIASVAH